MMKFSLLVSPLLALLLSAAPSFAQTDVAAGKPSDATVAGAGDAPSRQVELFFRQLTEGRVDAAYDGLLKGTRIGEMKGAAALRENTRKAIQVFGAINGYEQTGVKTVGSRLMRITCLSLGKNLPIRWRFYFYCTGDAWKLVDIRIDDRLPDLFEEPAAETAAPAQKESK